MMWFWLNVPLMVAFFGAMCGIPLAKVLLNPEWGPGRAAVAAEPAGAVFREEPQVPELVLADAR
jgi:hypothetical protein